MPRTLPLDQTVPLDGIAQLRARLSWTGAVKRTPQSISEHLRCGLTGIDPWPIAFLGTTNDKGFFRIRQTVWPRRVSSDDGYAWCNHSALFRASRSLFGLGPANPSSNRSIAFGLNLLDPEITDILLAITTPHGHDLSQLPGLHCRLLNANDKTVTSSSAVTPSDRPSPGDIAIAKPESSKTDESVIFAHLGRQTATDGSIWNITPMRHARASHHLKDLSQYAETLTFNR